MNHMLTTNRKSLAGRALVLLLLGAGAALAALGYGSAPAVAAGNTLNVCPSGCPYNSIRAAINAAAAGDTINIAAGTYTEAGIIVDKNLTIQGAGAASTVVQAADSAGVATKRVFLAQGAVNVTFKDMTIRYGSDTGGGIYVDTSATITLMRSTISDNAAYRGGGIYINTGGTAMVTNSTISGNSAYEGGGIYINGGTASITDSILSGNSVPSADGSGGGMLVFANSTATVTNSTLSGNTVPYGGGGGVRVVSSTATFINSILEGNGATFGGGILVEYGSTVNVANSTLSGNLASPYSGGGMVVRIDSTANVTNSTLSGNSAKTVGGGINVNTGGTANVTNSTLSYNSASPFYGGGIYVNTDGTANIANSIVASQASDGDCAGPITSLGYNLSSDDTCDFKLPSDKPGVSPNIGLLQDNGGLGAPATIALDADSPAIGAIPAGTNGCGDPLTQDQRGVPRPYKGACDIGAFQTPLSPPEQTVTTTDDEFGENRGKCSLREAIQAANTDVGFGGCWPGTGADTISLPAGAYRLTRAGADEDNNATGDLDITSSLPLTITGAGRDTTYVDADNLDRVFHIMTGTVQIDGVTVQNGLVEDNNGGGIYVDTAATILLTQSTIRDNTAYHGGGIFLQVATATVTNNMFSSNRATHSGGGIFVSYGNATVTNSILNANTAAHNGGGILVNYGMATVTNSTISGNTADQGGGVFNDRSSMDIRFTTLAWNGTNRNLGAHIANGGIITLTATVLAQPQGGASCEGITLATNGYNRISDASCIVDTAEGDMTSAAIALKPLALNKGLTLNHAPVMGSSNSVLDIVPIAKCEQWLGPDPTDQRGQPRPRQVYDKNYCDAGSVELAKTSLFVCGPPLAAAGTPERCEYVSIAAALAEAVDDDTITVAGVITETVTVTRSVTIRGPSLAESTPGTHLGIVQGALTAPANHIDPIFTIGAGAHVTIQDLNIRNGNAGTGSAISNAGTLTLQGVTLYANNADVNGSVVWNSATLVISNSTLTDNTGAGPLIRNVVDAPGSVQVHFATLAGAGTSLLQNGATSAAAMSVANSIITSTISGQCNNVTSGGGNLYGDCFVTTAAGDRTGDPGLGQLRDNGGPTLTRAIGPSSLARGGVTACDAALDQRGRVRPAVNCASGAVAYAPQTLTVCAVCDADPANGRYNDVQQALNQAMAGDIVTLKAGVYTGNFIVTKDLTLQHAGIEVSTLSREQPVDVRAILQASANSFTKQHQLNSYAGPVLTVQSYMPISATIAPAGDVNVILRGLTIRNGASHQGGGIYNLGTLAIFTTTVAENVAYNGSSGVYAMGGGIYNAGRVTLERSTVSGNQSEFYAGALYNAGPSVSETGTGQAVANIVASTIADNRASRLPDQRVVAVTDSGMTPISLTVQSGDEIRFDNQTANGRTLNITVGVGGNCQPSQVTVPVMGAGLSSALICSMNGNIDASALVTVTDSSNATLALNVTVLGVTDTPAAHAIYPAGNSQVRIARSIVFSSFSTGQSCSKSPDDIYAVIASGGYNLVSDSSCLPDPAPTDMVDLTQVAKLGPLQDNNSIDFDQGRISGYTYTRAPLPGSAAIDRIAQNACAADSAMTIAVTSGALPAMAIAAGDTVVWSQTAAGAKTVALNDGEAGVILLTLPAAGATPPWQFTVPGSYTYRVYSDTTRAEVAAGIVTVNATQRPVDQRGVALPQRGTTAGSYNCDVGAVEFQPWIVGQPVPRPPTALGTEAPQWQIGDATTAAQDYHAWSPATGQDIPIRPTRVEDNPPQSAVLTWVTHASPLLRSQDTVVQTGIVLWPDAPQIHVAGAGVSFSHDQVDDGYMVAASSARAFEGTDPADDAAGNLVTNGVFKRTELSDIAGDSYSVLQFTKGSQASVSLKVAVVKTVKWSTPGVQDVALARTACTIGEELVYRPAEAQQHDDPSGLSGQVLAGMAYDGVENQIDLASFQNTVDGLVPPAYVRATRTGPILPVLEVVPNPAGRKTAGGNDLEVAWYRPDARHVGWPVKTVAYNCAWPQNPRQIVIASELGSEVDGQPLLTPDAFANPSVYHQPVTGQPGYSPNWEHTLLSTSNLGNSAPALYALRTDLWDRNTNTAGVAESYALLKYQDPRQDNRTQIAVYKVVLTRAAAALSPAPVVRIGAVDLPADGEVTVPVEVVGAQNLAAITATVQYPAQLEPIGCAPNRQSFMEATASLVITTDAPARVQDVVRMRADLAAGTDVSYLWDFQAETPAEEPGSVRIDGAEVSYVYNASGAHTVKVTASNGEFAATVATVQVQIDPVDGSRQRGVLAPANTNGCRISGANTIELVLKTRSKHGLSGNLILADVSFRAVADVSTTPATTVSAASGPDYTALRYNVTAGNPVYAPVPLRTLLDTQACDQTSAHNPAQAKPFWKDWKGMLWARAAGDMQVLYYYPLQPGFYLSAAQAAAVGLDGLTEADRVGRCVPWLHNDNPANTIAAGSVRVYPVDYHVAWPALPALMSVGETVYERAKGGVSGVANQEAVARIYDDLAPGAWDGETIALTGSEAITTITQLIDPVGEVHVHLDVQINGNWSLPNVIKSERLLFGGGNAIVGNKDDPNLALPFALRSRVTFDDRTGDIVFKGYYDGASPEYLKGDPLLLLNVMSDSDRKRLRLLCEDDQGKLRPTSEPGISQCSTYLSAIDALYWATLNPRQLDLCRAADGALFAGDPNPAKNQGEIDDSDYEKACPANTGRDRTADHAFLIGVQDADNDGIPEPYAGLGKGKALSAGNAAGTGYVTLAYNNDASLGGLPVSLQVIKVGCDKVYGEGADGPVFLYDSPYRGNVLVVQSDNFFDEKLTLRHTGDFGGRPDNYEFEWYIAEVDETGVSPNVAPPAYPWRKWTDPGPGADAVGPEITIEGANPTTLSDNWLVVRYRNTTCNVCGNQYRYSALAGDPSAKPTELRGQLAEGWIKRVTNALNPFDTRVDDFVSSPVNTSVDMVRQAGPRYEGPIAMNADPENLNSIGLIEAYQTVLARGRALSIDSSINHQGANAALLNVTTRIANLYMLLANDAYNDALDPTVALGTDSALGMRAPAIFSFMNQFSAAAFGLIDEELALLRGRDETLGGVAAAPTYNRLTWNFTNGDGEVAYVMNYNIRDFNHDGFVNEADAAIQYPQGHGDAWGHYLTALTTYYALLRHPSYTWIPRAEPISVGGAPVVVDYYDERRFAEDAAAKARMGAEIVDLTYRKAYADPDSQPYVDEYVDPSDTCNTTTVPGCNRRAWGVDDWARRASQGAYFDWVVANAILPPEETRYTDLRKIDRTTVFDIGAIADEGQAIQEQLDEADNNVNPLGLVGNAVLFDLDPALVAEGKTHFEQVYDRAIGSLANTLKLFEYANQVKLTQRTDQNTQRDFVATIIDQDTALINDLIELFGYPYDADIGVNGTYPAGYDGPDIYNYDLWDRIELTDAEKRCSEADRNERCAAKTETVLLEYYAMPCIGFFPEPIKTPSTGLETCKTNEPTPLTFSITHTVGIGLDAGRGRFKPEAWPEYSARRAPGEIQNKLQALNQARIEYEKAIQEYANHVAALEGKLKAIKDRTELLRVKGQLTNEARWTTFSMDTSIAVINSIMKTAELTGKTVEEVADNASTCLPLDVGLANDVTSGFRCTLRIVGSTTKTAFTVFQGVQEWVSLSLGLAKQAKQAEVDTQIFEKESDYELKQMGSEMAALLREEKEKRLALFLAKDKVNSAQGDYDQVLNRGFRKLEELIRLRQRWAGQISENRYNDMAYRIYQTDALQKYRSQFDLAQQYTYLAAAAYDYETNLAGDDPAGGVPFLRAIVGQRSLGELRWTTGPWDVEPIVGSGGLAEFLGKMRDNFAVLKGQMGFNNPQYEANRFSLRQELFRLRDESDAAWQQTLARFYTPDIFSNDAVARLAKRPYGESGPEPGLVIPMGTSIIRRLNFFGLPLGPGDSSYSSTQFSTKIAAAGVWFEGYDIGRLAQTPRVYLIPAGSDVIRPRDSDGLLRYWNVTEQLLPLPHVIGPAEMEDAGWIPRIDGLTGAMYAIKPYADMRAFPYSEDFNPDQMNTDTRLIGRSVWNTQWLLVVPGATLLADPQLGIDRFIEDVDDIYVYFQTYAYAGTSRSAETPLEMSVSAAQVASDLVSNPVSRTAAQLDSADLPPRPDAIAYGSVLFNGEPKTDGTVRALLPDGSAVTAAIGVINGTDYGFVLDLPVGPVNASPADQIIQFFVDDLPAFFKDKNELTTALFTPVSGQPALLDLSLDGSTSYMLGDVNASGRRNSADALLTLKYDIGLIIGVTDFPPGPNTVYLPLCDIVENGRCDSGDALRILQCDVGSEGIACPGAIVAASAASTAAGSTAQAPMPGASTTVRVVASEAQESDTIDVRVLLADGATGIGAGSFELHYDPARFAPMACSENPAGSLDMVACNADFAPGTARFNLLTASGSSADTTIVELRFARLAAAGPDLADSFTLTSGGVADLDGNDIPWSIAAGQAETAPAEQHRIYLPVVAGQGGQQDGANAQSTVAAPMSDEPVLDEPSQEQPVQEVPAQDEPVTEEPFQEQPVQEVPAQDEPAEDQPVQEVPEKEEPAEDEPVQDEPVQDQPVEDKPAEDEPVQDEPIQDQPVQEVPAQDEPVQDDPCQDQPVQEEPAQGEPVQDDPCQDQPVQEEPAQGEPVQDDPCQDQPVQEEPAQDEPGQDDPFQDQPLQEDPIQEEPVQEEPSTQHQIFPPAISSQQFTTTATITTTAATPTGTVGDGSQAAETPDAGVPAATETPAALPPDEAVNGAAAPSIYLPLLSASRGQ